MLWLQQFRTTASIAAAAQIPPSIASDPTALAAYTQDDSGPPMRIVSIILPALSTLIVALRLYSRRIAGLDLWWDDYLIVFGLLSGYGVAAHGVASPSFGMGRHTALVKDQFPTLALLEYSVIWTYSVSVTATKLAILLMYARIFPLASPWSRNHRPAGSPPLGGRYVIRQKGMDTYSVVWHALFVGVAVFGVSFTFVQIFTCYPLARNWTVPPPDGMCINNTAQWWNIGLNIVFDVAILSLPVGKILRLDLKASQKLYLCGIFLLGGFVTIASVVRCYYVAIYRTTVDPTYDLAPCISWTVIELFVGTICACLPVMRPLVLLLLHRGAKEPRSPPSTHNAAKSPPIPPPQPYRSAFGSKRADRTSVSQLGLPVSAYEVRETQQRDQPIQMDRQVLEEGSSNEGFTLGSRLFDDSGSSEAQSQSQASPEIRQVGRGEEGGWKTRV